jgi:hypothetical protein
LADLSRLLAFGVSRRSSRLLQDVSLIGEGDPDIPPDLWSSFIYAVIQEAAMSFIDIVEEDVERPASDDNEGGDKKPDLIN